MEEAFKRFADQVPQKIYTETEKYHSADIIIFRPQAFLIAPNIIMPDYHFAMPFSTPPPMSIDNREYQFRKGRMLALAPGSKLLCALEAPARPYIAMNIKDAFFKETSRVATGKEVTSFSRVDNPYSPILIDLIHSFEVEIENFRCSSPLMLQSISIQIVIQLLRATEDYFEKKNNRCITAISPWHRSICMLTIIPTLK